MDDEQKTTKEELKKINSLYDYKHNLNDKDVEVANAYILAIENSRTSYRPQAGDILLVNGKQHHIDIIENHGNGQTMASVCENAYTPFTSVKFNGGHGSTISLSTSGGAWYSINIGKLKRKEEQAKKTFCFWGHCGATGDGAIDVPAMVNVWEEKN